MFKSISNTSIILALVFAIFLAGCAAVPESKTAAQDEKPELMDYFKKTANTCDVCSAEQP